MVDAVTWPGVSAIHSHPPTVQVGETLVSRRGAWVHTGSDGEPDASISFEIRDGRPECTEVVVRAKPGGREVRTSDLDSFRLEALAITVLSNYAIRLGDGDEDPIRRFRADLPRDSDDSRAMERDVYAARTSRRGRVTREELEAVARTYRDHVDGAPVQAVMALRGLSQRTAARRISQAREAGLLPPTTKGKRRAQ